jgi:hypothetical protein
MKKNSEKNTEGYCILNNFKGMKSVYTLFLTLLVLFFALGARADAGPKPHMKFTLVYAGNQPTAIYQLQYDREDADAPTDTLHDRMKKGPEGFRCTGSDECRSVAYSYRPFHRLLFIFENDTLLSPIFRKTAFRSHYLVTVHNDRIELENKTSWFFREDSPYPFLRAALITFSTELSVLILLLFLFRYPMKKEFLAGALVANVVSLPVFWFGIMGLFNSAGGWLGGEIAVVLFEAFVLWMFIRKSEKFGKILLLSFILNFLSVMAGGAALFISLFLA